MEFSMNSNPREVRRRRRLLAVAFAVLALTAALPVLGGFCSKPPSSYASWA
jgi:hypothetical protein